MDAHLLQLNLNVFRARLSRRLRCQLSVADVADLLRSAGFEETPVGWLTYDLRPLMMTFVPSGAQPA
ncbi:MAG TPA: hypothetical protein PLP66_05330 [Phycisphaerae bacterium]|nr:hypothetical protein [Phycisphaerae bacterium]HPM23305.1 hypothetical protein [Phycisphaerae bacterium]